MVARPRSKAKIAKRSKRCEKCGALIGRQTRCRKCHKRQ
ncbi:hypothetical protein Mal4_13820 [Maioricimonas rarisocia]|uniref:50S ribosomal protein L40e n=1 Tax=Maioricimonas rarisocia TaxID=2528026 RepID=A0A517Z3L1_9PLAN|nr:hypothetical protein Mal4_13820 [Maioricimonas rarisocia]